MVTQDTVFEKFQARGSPSKNPFDSGIKDTSVTWASSQCGMFLAYPTLKVTLNSISQHAPSMPTISQHTPVLPVPYYRPLVHCLPISSHQPLRGPPFKKSSSMGRAN